MTKVVNEPKILGMIWKREIQNAYQKEIERREISTSLASSISMREDIPNIHFMEGYSITEIAAPTLFICKSIRELNIRALYGVDVLSIKINEKGGEKKSYPLAFLCNSEGGYPDDRRRN